MSRSTEAQLSSEVPVEEHRIVINILSNESLASKIMYAKDALIKEKNLKSYHLSIIDVTVVQYDHHWSHVLSTNISKFRKKNCLDSIKILKP